MEESVAIEKHTSQRLEERQAQREKYRDARAERIAAGIPDPGDCQDHQDVVCPHCGNWHPGKGPTEDHHQRCASCAKWFDVHVRTEYRFSSSKSEPDTVL
jgi:hypothetical protein